MSILPLLNKFIPLGIAIRGIEKINPNLKRFIGSATAAGYGTDKILDFLRSRVEGQESSDEQRLEQGYQEGTLRPDEKALRRSRKQAEVIPNAIQGAATLGAGALGGLAGMALGGDKQPMQHEQEEEPAEDSNVIIPPMTAANERDTRRNNKILNRNALSQSNGIQELPQLTDQSRSSSDKRRIAALQEFQRRQKAENEQMKPSAANLKGQFERQYGQSGDREQQFIQQLRQLAAEVGL